MKILFLLISMPHLGKTSNMYSSLIKTFIKNGHEVLPVAPAENGGNIGLVEEGGVRVLRVKTLPLFGTGFIRKGLANVLLPFQYQRAIDKFLKYEKFDLIVSPTPPITLVNVVETMKRRCGAKAYLILRDIFPQNAADLGIIKKWWPIFWKFRLQEKKLYRVCDKIGCMSQGNIDYVKIHNPEVPAEKLCILENFQDLETPKNADLTIRERYNLVGKFVVIFGGNMGIPQKLENVLDLAKACEGYQDVLFLFVGKGMHRTRIERIAKEKDVNNARFVDYIPHEDYQQLVAQCDLGLISLNERFTIPNIPSKTLSYFNLSVPVLASLDAATDYGKILEEADAGLWSLAGDLKLYKANFDKLYSDSELRKKMGENGRRYLETHMTTDVAYKQMISQLCV